MKSKEEKNNMLERENGTGESRRLFSLLILCVILIFNICENQLIFLKTIILGFHLSYKDSSLSVFHQPDERTAWI